MQKVKYRYRVIILTYNAEPWARDQLGGLTRSGVSPEQVLVIDSSSTDGTRELYKEWGAKVAQISQEHFNHGGTRRWAAEQSEEFEILVYLTQDAIPANEQTFTALLAAFDDGGVAVAFGRQLPRPGAGAIESHARLFNYPTTSAVVSLSDKETLGSKVTFCSDSFAAYRNSALKVAGGFPSDAFFAEDQIVAARMLNMGFKKGYVAEAQVYHSHEYSLAEDFKRYFDVGVFHSRNPWLIAEFGRSEGEGARFVRSEIRHLLGKAPIQILESIIRTGLKCLGYTFGKLEKHFSVSAKKNLSASPYYWK